MWPTVLALAAAHEPRRDHNVAYWCARFRPHAHMAPPEARARLFLLKRLHPSVYSELLTPDTVAHFDRQHWCNLWDQRAWPELVTAIGAAMRRKIPQRVHCLWHRLWYMPDTIPARWGHRCAVALWQLANVQPAVPKPPFQKYVYTEGEWKLLWITPPVLPDRWTAGLHVWLNRQRGDARRSLRAQWVVKTLRELGQEPAPPPPRVRLVQTRMAQDTRGRFTGRVTTGGPRTRSARVL